ncbi:MAG: hypothetical protein ABJI96_18735 [Paracoccaceae bacterium]
MVRPHDLLALRIGLRYLRVRAGTPPVLQKSRIGASYLVLHYPPQAIAAQPPRRVDTCAGGSVTLSASLARNLAAVGSVATLADPPFWTLTATLSDTGRCPSRLMLREFERCYPDHTVG